MLFAVTFLELLLFLLILRLFLFLFILLLALSLRVPLVSCCVVSLRRLTLLRVFLSLLDFPLLGHRLLLLLLLTLYLFCMLMGSGVSQLHGLFIGMLLFLPSWMPLHGLPPLSLLPSISLMYSSLPLRALVCVWWWLQVQWFSLCFGGLSRY